MNTLDIILAVPLAYGIIRGLTRGLIIEVVSLTSIAIGLYASVKLSKTISEYMLKYYNWPEDNIKFAAFVLIFIISIMLVGLLSKVLTKMLEKNHLGGLNRAAGALFGLVKWSVICGGIMVFLDKFFIEIIPKETITESVLYSPIENFSKFLIQIVFPEIK